MLWLLFFVSGASGGAAAAAAIDEDLFDDEDLDELEEDMTNLNMEMWTNLGWVSVIIDPCIKSSNNVPALREKKKKIHSLPNHLPNEVHAQTFR